jgi:ribosome maturation factor RimP
MTNSANDIRQKLLRMAEQAAMNQGLEIADIELLGKGKKLLRVFIDKQDGVTLDDCERFSKSFGALMDIESPFTGSYTLEVSSPGLDRPLKTIDDFEKNKGKLARIITAEKIENQNFFLGRIAEVHDMNIRIVIGEHVIDIPFHTITKARLEIEL